MGKPIFASCLQEPLLVESIPLKNLFNRFCGYNDFVYFPPRIQIEEKEFVRCRNPFQFYSK